MLLICPGTLPSGAPCRNVLAWVTLDTVEIRHRHRRYVVRGTLEWVVCEDCGLTSAADTLTRRAGALVA